MKNLKWILAGLLVLSWVFKSYAATPEAFASINVELAAAVQAEPLSLNVADVTKFRWLSDAQLAALLKLLAATPTIAVEDLPGKGRGGTYYSLQHPEWPPLPGDTSFSPAWIIGSTGAIDKTYLLSDLDFSYEDAAKKSASGGQMWKMFGGEGEGFEYSMMSYGSNQLWLEVISVDLANQAADILAHNTRDDLFIQLLTKTNLLQPAWTLVDGIGYGTPGTNQTDFNPVSIGDNTNMFFWAQQAAWSVSVSKMEDAIEPHGNTPGQDGIFHVTGMAVTGITNPLTVYYRMSGTASNGGDYISLSGMVLLTNGAGAAIINVQPKADTLVEGVETATLTVIPTNTYLIFSENQSVATVTISDAYTTVGIGVSAGNTIEPRSPSAPPAVPATFSLHRDDSRNFFTNLTVYYAISGTASNGADYTFLTNKLEFAAGMQDTNIDIHPLADFLIENDETVTLTLVATNDYLVKSNAAAASITIADIVVFETVVTNFPGPIGIDYHAPSNAIIVSFHFNGGVPFNFARINTNLVMSNSVVMTNTVVTNWSGVHDVGNEVKLATVKANAGGFTNGEIYFGSGAAIGKLSANGTISNLTWCVLTNSAVTNALPLRGSLYVDQTGVFSNQVIAVTSDADGSGSQKGVWRVDALGNPTLLTNLDTLHLEGVITLPNDLNKWGPWAGKIITGDEDKFPPLIYTIATNGAVVPYDTTTLFPEGIATEDFDIIPANQSLYLCDNGNRAIKKLSANYFANHVGDLLITQAGEVFFGAKLFIVHWDNATSSFVTLSVPYNDGFFEHATFAPIDLPPKN